jgi:hypothetical protein
MKMRKRTKYNLSHYHVTSCDLGELIPVSCVEVDAGDTFRGNTSMLLRFGAMDTPVMHPLDVHIHHFFVPFRILWSGWEDFITGVSATPPPKISGAAFSSNTLQHYLGVYDDASNNYNALFVRAYNKIYNEYYRDSDLITEVSEDSTSIQKVAWGRDYFTESRPWQQKGTAVTLPLGTSAPLSYSPSVGATLVRNPNTGALITTAAGLQNDSIGRVENATTGDVDLDLTNSHTADLSSATGPSVVDFRESFAIHTYQENRARYGSDFVDYLRFLGINPSDGRLQRPEYLGGGKETVQISEVMDHGSSVGTYKGHGISALRTNKYQRFFEEHGVCMTMAFVRPRTMYLKGLHAKFSKTTKEDYFQQELAQVGAQEIYNKEVYAPHSTPDGVFSYGDRYREYREEPSRVSGMFTTTDKTWHFGRDFSSDPALNQTFLECVPDETAWSQTTNHNVYMMSSNNIVARRRIPHIKPGRGL